MQPAVPEKINYSRKSGAILLNDRCPLKCAHCSIGYSATNTGTTATIQEDQLVDLINALVDNGFDTIAFAGGEPGLVPKLLRIGLKTTHERGVRSVLVTAPVWAKSLAGAERFLSGLTHLDTVALSYDRHHLDFLAIEHYTNAVTAAQAAGCTVAFNVCYSHEEERAELQASLLRIYPTMRALPKNLSGVFGQAGLSRESARDLVRARLSKAPFVNFERIIPVGNAASLPGVLSTGVKLESIEDFDRIERSCNIGNVIVDTRITLHACCWSPAIPGSPLAFGRDPDAAFASTLNRMDDDQRVCDLKQKGLIGSLTVGEKEHLLASLHGQTIVNECHLCLSALARPERASVQRSSALPRQEGATRGVRNEAASTPVDSGSPGIKRARFLFPADLAPDDETDRERRLRLAGLHEKGKRQQWDAMADLDWTTDDFVLPRPDGSLRARESFRDSPLSVYGPDTWSRFQSEFQNWMVSQFLPGEHTAMLASARLVEGAPHEEARLCLAAQTADEARHVEVFSRYVREKITHPYPTEHSLSELLQRATAERSWDISVLGLHVVVEALALAAFRLGDRTFHGPLIRTICARVAADEARHVAIGVLCLRNIYPTLTADELKYREDFVVAAVHLVRQQFLFDEIWDRLGIPRQIGRAFAETNPVLLEYRRIICSRLISALASIGLLTTHLWEQLQKLDLLSERQLARMRWPRIEIRPMGKP